LPSGWDKKGCDHCREKQRHYGIRVAFLTAINNEESPLSPLWGDVRLERGKCSEKTAPNRDRNVIVVAVRRIRFAVTREKILRHSRNMCSPPNHPDISHRADFFFIVLKTMFRRKFFIANNKPLN
jgi:hypothetical protein